MSERKTCDQCKRPSHTMKWNAERGDYSHFCKTHSPPYTSIEWSELDRLRAIEKEATARDQRITELESSEYSRLMLRTALVLATGDGESADSPLSDRELITALSTKIDMANNCIADLEALLALCQTHNQELALNAQAAWQQTKDTESRLATEKAARELADKRIAALGEQLKVSRLVADGHVVEVTRALDDCARERNDLAKRLATADGELVALREVVQGYVNVRRYLDISIGADAYSGQIDSFWEYDRKLQAALAASPRAALLAEVVREAREFHETGVKYRADGESLRPLLIKSSTLLENAVARLVAFEEGA